MSKNRTLVKAERKILPRRWAIMSSIFCGFISVIFIQNFQQESFINLIDIVIILVFVVTTIISVSCLFNRYFLEITSTEIRFVNIFRNQKIDIQSIVGYGTRIVPTEDLHYDEIVIKTVRGYYKIPSNDYGDFDLIEQYFEQTHNKLNDDDFHYLHRKETFISHLWIYGIGVWLLIMSVWIFIIDSTKIEPSLIEFPITLNASPQKANQKEQIILYEKNHLPFEFRITGFAYDNAKRKEIYALSENDTVFIKIESTDYKQKITQTVVAPFFDRYINYKEIRVYGLSLGEQSLIHISGIKNDKRNNQLFSIILGGGAICYLLFMSRVKMRVNKFH